MIAHPRRSHERLGSLLAAAALGLGRLLNLRLRDGLDRLLLGLTFLGQAILGTIVVEEQHLAGDDHRARAQLATRLVVPGLVFQSADYPHVLALAHILVDDLG